MLSQLPNQRQTSNTRPHSLRVGLPETSLGLIPGSGGTQRLPRLIGIGPATKLIMEAKILGAAEALKLGIVDKIVSPEQLIDTARYWVLQNPNPLTDCDGFRLLIVGRYSASG